MEKTADLVKQLWAHLDSLGEGNIFAVYPKILEEIFLQQERQREDEQRPELETLALPSDMEWRLKAYFKLVQQQRDLDDAPENEASALDKLRTARRWSRADSTTDPWTALIETDSSSRRQSMKPSFTSRNSSISGASLPRISGIVDSLRTSIPGSSTTTADSVSSSSFSSPVQNALNYCGPPWGPRDVAKAARLLEKPPLPVNFEDDHEMRRVYSLIYDVFRYKGVFEEALNDVDFYGVCPEAFKRRHMCWLLLLDQQRRGWARRECSKNPLLIIRMRDAEESMASRRKFSVSSDVSNNSDTSVESFNRISRRSSVDAKDLPILKSQTKSKKDISPETRDLIRRAKENIDRGLGTILPILENPKPVAELESNRATETTLPDIHSKNLTQVCQKDGNEDKMFRSNKNVANREEPFNVSSRNLGSESSQITLEEIRNTLKSIAGEVGDNLLRLDDSLWNNRIKIAAALAKIRIRNQALSLSDLLPPHLRDEKVALKSDLDVVNGWVNVFKIRGISDLMQRLNEMGYSYSTTKMLDTNQFYFDKYCPRFISVKPAHRKKFMSSSLMNDKLLVLEEREFCIGAAATCKAMREAQLRGDIIQTHGASPRSIAYLASQLRDHGPEAGDLMVFGAGSRKSEYDAVMRTLGATNVRIYSELAADAANVCWTSAVAALVSPPNSYSAVQDPIDLICSRGGDLGVLEDLTESQMNMDGKLRIMKILEDQKNVLKLCMSKPQIQMIIYETHSILNTENSEMVKRSIAESNRDVRELHAMRKQKLKESVSRAPKCAQKSEQTEETETETEPTVERRQSNTNAGTPRDTKSDSKGTPRRESVGGSAKRTIVDRMLSPVITDPDTEFADVKVPDCDVFEEILPVPLAELSKREREGCYLALIQRKELVKLNAKYMIQMAETRGLFGGSSPPPRRPQPSRTKIVKEEKPKEVKRKLSDSQKPKPTRIPSAVLDNYIQYRKKNGQNKLVIKKSVPQILLNKLKKYIKKKTRDLNTKGDDEVWLQYQ